MNCTKEEAEVIVNKYWEREWNKIKSMDLPDTREFPITEKHMIQEFKNLCEKQLGNKAKSDIIHHFFPSIFTARRQGKLSPVEFWEKIKTDSELFKKFYLNRLMRSDWFNEKNGANLHYLNEGYVPNFIYAIGATTSGIAPCPSYFKPAYIKNLINKYAANYTTVFDPFCGYGKFLGALAANKNYIGCDINDITIQENKNCLKFIETNFPDLVGKVDLVVADAFSTTGKYENTVMISCPPYSDAKGKQIEIWKSSTGEIECSYTCDEIIDKILRNYECDKYIFIVDDSMKNFRKYIVEKFENINYINSRNHELTDASHNYEAVVVITKQQRDGLIK